MARSLNEEKGELFEKRVETALVAGGFRVQRRRAILGFQFDIIAIRDEEFGAQKRIAIECKYKSEGEVSNVEAAKFINSFRLLKKDGFFQGILVSNAYFSRGAWAASADEPSVLLKNIIEFEDEFLGLRKAFRDAARRFEPLANYISLSARAASTLDAPVTLAAPSINLENGINSLLARNTRTLSVIFGDFGSGKTTSLKQVNCTLQNAYLDGTSTALPFLFYLRDYKEGDLIGFVERQLQAGLRLNWSYETFSSVIRSSNSVVLLDGFDEIAISATEQKRSLYFLELIKILEVARHTVLTTRPSYFSSFSELKKLFTSALRAEARKLPEIMKITRPNSKAVQQEMLRRAYGTDEPLSQASEMHIYFLEGLSREKIAEYLKYDRATLLRLYNLDEEQVLQRLEEIYDLRDVMKRPLLLEIILFVLKTGKFPITKATSELSAAVLYNIYVQEHVKYERTKGKSREFLEPHERLAFARAMAIAMLEGDGSLAVTYPTILEVIYKHRAMFVGKREAVLLQPLEAIATDICVCGFLTLRFDSRFEFVHRSFFEFFAAVEAREEITRTAEGYICGKYLQKEILYFMGGLLQEDPSLVELFLQRVRGGAGTRNFRRNVYCAILYSRIRDERVPYDSFDFSGVEFKEKIFDRASFTNTKMAENKIDKLVFDNCTLNQFDIDKCRFDALTFRNCTGLVTVAADTTIHELECESSRGAFRLQLGSKCASVSLSGVRGRVEGTNIGRQFHVRQSQLVISHYDGRSGRDVGRAVQSQMFFVFPELDGLTPAGRRSLIDQMGDRFVEILSDWNHVDVVNAVMNRDQYDDFKRHRNSTNRAIIILVDTDREMIKGKRKNAFRRSEVITTEGDNVIIKGDQFGLRCVTDFYKAAKLDEITRENMFDQTRMELRAILERMSD